MRSDSAVQGRQRGKQELGWPAALAYSKPTAWRGIRGKRLKATPCAHCNPTHRREHWGFLVWMQIVCYEVTDEMNLLLYSVQHNSKHLSKICRDTNIYFRWSWHYNIVYFMLLLRQATSKNISSICRFALFINPPTCWKLNASNNNVNSRHNAKGAKVQMHNNIL